MDPEDELKRFDRLSHSFPAYVRLIEIKHRKIDEEFRRLKKNVLAEAAKIGAPYFKEKYKTTNKHYNDDNLEFTEVDAGVSFSNEDYEIILRVWGVHPNPDKYPVSIEIYPISVRAHKKCPQFLNEEISIEFLAQLEKYLFDSDLGGELVSMLAVEYERFLLNIDSIRRARNSDSLSSF